MRANPMLPGGELPCDSSFMDFVRWLFCKHRNMMFIRNIYGDEIVQTGGRSLWHCPNCKMWEFRPELHQAELGPVEGVAV